MALTRFRAAPLPNPPADYNPQYMRQFIRVLENYFSQLDSRTPNYAQSYSADDFFGGRFRGVFLLTSEPFTASGTPAAATSVVLADCTGGPITVSLPAAADSTGRVLSIKKIDATANDVTIDGDASETIDGSTTLVFSVQYMSVTIYCDGTEWWVI